MLLHSNSKPKSITFARTCPTHFLKKRSRLHLRQAGNQSYGSAQLTSFTVSVCCLYFSEHSASLRLFCSLPDGPCYLPNGSQPPPTNTRLSPAYSTQIFFSFTTSPTRVIFTPR